MFFFHFWATPREVTVVRVLIQHWLLLFTTGKPGKTLQRGKTELVNQARGLN
jgi:hypothetical protein